MMAFWAQVMRLRDLLKFEFYFADSASFREHILEEMSWQDNCEQQLAEGGEALRALVLCTRSAPLHDERLADEMAAFRAHVGLAMHGRLARRGWRRGERAPFHELGA